MARETPSSSSLLEAKTQGPALSAIHDFISSVGAKLNTVERLAADVLPLLQTLPSDTPEQGEKEDLCLLIEELEAREREAEALSQALNTPEKRLEGLWQAEMYAKLAAMKTELLQNPLPHINLEKTSQQIKLLREEQLKEEETEGWIRTELFNMIENELESLRREANIRAELAIVEFDKELQGISREIDEIAVNAQPKDISALAEAYIIRSLQALEDVKRTVDPALRVIMRAKAIKETQEQAIQLQKALQGSLLARQTSECQRKLEIQLDNCLSG